MLTIREAKYVCMSGYMGNSQLSTQFCYKPKIALKISLLEDFFFFLRITVHHHFSLQRNHGEQDRTLPHL